MIVKVSCEDERWVESGEHSAQLYAELWDAEHVENILEQRNIDRKARFWQWIYGINE